MIYPEINVALLKATEARIKANPKSWDQSAYLSNNSFCGTVMCVAGHALTIAGSVWKYDEVNQWVPSLPEALKSFTVSDVYPYGYWSIAGMAQELLGLTEQEASELFFGLWGNNVSELEALVDKIISGHYRGLAAEVSL